MEILVQWLGPFLPASLQNIHLLLCFLDQWDQSSVLLAMCHIANPQKNIHDDLIVPEGPPESEEVNSQMAFPFVHVRLLLPQEQTIIAPL